MDPVQQPLLNLGLHDGHRFESFYPGENNALPVEELKSLLNGAGHGQIFLWGAEGTGKSHLLQACCQTAFTQGSTAAYIPLSAMKHHGVGIFAGAEIYQLICVDDLHLVMGDEDWQVALFNLINQARVAGQQLVFSAEQNPRHMPCTLPDLQSRLLWNGNYQLHELSDEEKAGALKTRAAVRGISLDNAVIEYIFKRYPRDFTTLIGILDKLDHESMTSKRKITIPLVKQALKD